MSDERIAMESPEDLAAKGLVPTMWQIMDQARLMRDQGDSDDPPAAASEGTPEPAKPDISQSKKSKELTDGGSS